MSVCFLCKTFVLGFGCVCLLFPGFFEIQLSVLYLFSGFSCVFSLHLGNIFTPARISVIPHPGGHTARLGALVGCPQCAAPSTAHFILGDRHCLGRACVQRTWMTGAGKVCPHFGWLSDKLVVIQNQDTREHLRFKRQGSACLQQQVAMQNSSSLQLGKKQQHSRKYSSSLLEWSYTDSVLQIMFGCSLQLHWLS